MSRCAFEDCDLDGMVEVAGSEVGLPTNTPWGGTVVCEDHADNLRSDLSEFGDEIVEQLIAPPMEGSH